MNIGTRIQTEHATAYALECWGACGLCGACMTGDSWSCEKPFLKWADGFKNRVVNEGLDDLLSKYFKGSAYTAAFYVGLKGTGAVIAADSMASHAGWSELVPYSQGTRPALVLGAVASQSVDNSASKAQYSITSAADIYGAFLSTDSTKSGTSGALYGGGFFAGGTVTAATKANPGQVTVVAHGLVTGNKVLISGVGGMTQLNGNVYTVIKIDDDNFTIGVDTTGYSTFTSGGLVEKQRNVDSGDTLLVSLVLTAASA